MKNTAKFLKCDVCNIPEMREQQQQNKLINKSRKTKTIIGVEFRKNKIINEFEQKKHTIGKKLK